VSAAVYYWVVIVILLAGFLAGLVIFFTHDCEQTVWDHRYGKGPHGD
jgi:hypothetical protein